MIRSLAAFGLLASLPAMAALDKIDADGVTEVGGSSEYARMLPRTGSDGKLDMSLLPPVADWASQPIPGLYYVSSGMAAEGNGSPQYPFKTVTAAMAVATSGSAILVVPGTYSSTGTIQNGKVLSICGFGKSTYIAELTVEAVGTATLRLCGVSVGTLRINGGNLNVCLSGTRVSTLAGASEGVTITRTDTGSKVDAASIASYTDVYTGYDTIDKAKQLVGPASVGNLAFSNDRLKVGDSRTVAYTDDIVAATNSIGSIIEGLEDEDERLAVLISNEATVRAAADLVLSNSLETSEATLNSRIDSVSANWGTQLEAAVLNISRLSTTVTTLQRKETNDVATLSTSIAGVQSAYKAADTALSATLRGETSDAIDGLRDEIPTIADTQAAEIVADATPEIVKTARAQAYLDSSNMVAGVNTRVTAQEGEIDALDTTVSGHTSSIAALNATTGNLTSTLNSLSSRVDAYNNARIQDINTLNEWRLTMSTWQGTVNNAINKHKTTINILIDDMAILKNSFSTIVVPDKL